MRFKILSAAVAAVALAPLATFAAPATTLYGLESSWNWLDSFYYCFISLTTVSINSFFL